MGGDIRFTDDITFSSSELLNVLEQIQRNYHRLVHRVSHAYEVMAGQLGYGSDEMRAVLANSRPNAGTLALAVRGFPQDERWPDYLYALEPEGIHGWRVSPADLARGELVIGMVKNLHDDWGAEGRPQDAFGIGSTSLAWTRDGQTWVRDREVFFGPDPQPGAWDHAHAWIDEQLPVEDEVYLYYGGYKFGHKMDRWEGRQIGLVKMQRDRYVSRDAGPDGGTLITRRAVLAGAVIQRQQQQLFGKRKMVIHHGGSLPRGRVS